MARDADRDMCFAAAARSILPTRCSGRLMFKRTARVLTLDRSISTSIQNPSVNCGLRRWMFTGNGGGGARVSPSYINSTASWMSRGSASGSSENAVDRTAWKVFFRMGHDHAAAILAQHVVAATNTDDLEAVGKQAPHECTTVHADRRPVDDALVYTTLHNDFAEAMHAADRGARRTRYRKKNDTPRPACRSGLLLSRPTSNEASSCTVRATIQVTPAPAMAVDASPWVWVKPASR